VDGDVIMTYAKSHVVEMTFGQAFDEGKACTLPLLQSYTAPVVSNTS
jgi:translation initiation factor 2B subunit (eIF-2B alpha/beta/delta family)